MKITKRGSSWQASVIQDGKRTRYSFKTEQEARVWAAEAELAMAKGVSVPTRSDATGTGGKTIMELYRITHETRWSACWSDAMTILGNTVVRELGPDTDVSDIGFSTISSWIGTLRAKGLSQSTVNRRLAALSTMMGTAVNLGWIREKPKIPMGKESRKERRYLTHEEEETILSQLKGTREWGLAVVAADTGLRLSELLNLRWRSVRNDFVTVEKSKNGSPRTIPIPSRSRGVIAGIPRDKAGPFAGMDRFETSRRFKRAVVRSGIADDAVVFHSLRHTCASRLVMMGVDVMRVRQWMGHKSIATTMIYAHLAPDSLSDVVAKIDACTREKLLCESRATICGKLPQSEAS